MATFFVNNLPPFLQNACRTLLGEGGFSFSEGETVVVHERLATKEKKSPPGLLAGVQFFVGCALRTLTADIKFRYFHISG